MSGKASPEGLLATYLAYLSDVLRRMTDGHPVNRLDDLLPWNWTPTSVNP
jgi:hypothetical protein